MPSSVPHPVPPPAPGVTRLGGREASFYLLEDPGGLVLVNAGLLLPRRAAPFTGTPADAEAEARTAGLR